MKTTYVSTYTMANANRRSVLEMQAELVDRQKELTTGRVADAGLALGARTGQSVGLRKEHASLQAIIDSNVLAAGRLDATQQALTSIDDKANGFLAVLIDAKSNAADGNVTAARAEEQLAGLIGQLNSTQAGAYLFAGINTNVAPIAEYTAGSTPKQAVDDAFLAHFGFSQGDPAAASITAADMQDFLDNDFAALFTGAGWSASWSSASDETMNARISTGLAVSTGVSANIAPVQKLTAAYTMVAHIGMAGMSKAVQDTIVDRAMALTGEAMQGITETRARLGATQESVSSASERMSAQMDVIATHIGALESVDPYEASTRVTSLMTQIETSYAMTARLQQLSLLNYL